MMFSARTIPVALVLLGLSGEVAVSEESADAATPVATAPKPIVKDYCSSFVDSAAERRLSEMNEALKRTRAEVDARLEELKAKSEELKLLIDTRKAMQDKVADSLLKIYLQVEPEAAAQQLSKLEPSTAAEILVKMNPKRSGEILSLMDVKKAASLVALLTLQTSPEKDPKS